MTKGLEFGAAVECKFFANDGGIRKFAAASTLGHVIAGKACAWNEYHVARGGTIEVFTYDCFTKSLRSNRKVEFLLDHEPATKLGDTGDRLELYADHDGLWFKYWPSAEPSQQDVIAAVMSGERTQMSVGYSVLADECFEDRGGFKARILSEALLGEISLVRTDRAAVKSTAAFAVKSSELGNLEAEVQSGAMAIKSALRPRLAVLAGKMLEVWK